MQAAVQTRDDEYLEGSVSQPMKKDAAAGSRQQAVFLVKMASTSDGLPSSGGADSSDASAASGSSLCEEEQDVWYDCAEQEWYDAQDEQEAAQDACSAAGEPAEDGAVPLTAEQLACLQALPPRLSALLTKYLQVGAACRFV